MIGSQHHGMTPGEPPCMSEGMMDAKPHDMMGGEKMGMMGKGMHGMMQQRMDHSLFLDQADSLGLTSDQIASLKTIRSECQKDNIRSSAEARIVRLDLNELLDQQIWTMDKAEKLVRQLKKLEGDIQLRHLKALADAGKVLTAEQLAKAKAADGSEGLEELFQ
jgi:Spy/CpxP family protein refolding chaperone